MLKSQLASEAFPALEEGGPQRFFSQLPEEEQRKLLTVRLKKYCQKVRLRFCELAACMLHVSRRRHAARTHIHRAPALLQPAARGGAAQAAHRAPQEVLPEGAAAFLRAGCVYAPCVQAQACSKNTYTQGPSASSASCPRRSSATCARKVVLPSSACVLVLDAVT